MNHLIYRHPHLVVLGFWLTGAFRGVLWVFSNTAKLEIHHTCPQGYESTFFQDINLLSGNPTAPRKVQWLEGIMKK